MAKFEIRIDGDKCKGCELCRAHCPRNVLEMSPHFNNKGYSPASAAKPEDCIGCTSCALVCPDGAIEIYREETA